MNRHVDIERTDNDSVHEGYILGKWNETRERWVNIWIIDYESFLQDEKRE